MADNKDIGFVSGDDYLMLPRDPQPWIVNKLIPVGGLVNLFGRPKLGKSFAALGLAMAVANGDKDWLGFEIKKPGRVAYLQLDTPRSLWADRVNTIKSHGYNVNNVYFTDTIVSPYPFNILIKEHQQWLKDRLRATSPILVVADTLRELHGGDENDSTIMRNVVNAFAECIAPSAGLLLSHAKKEGNHHNGDDLMTDGRGSSYVAGRMDTMIKLTAKSMLYKGRAVGENKIRIYQDGPEGVGSGLIFLDDDNGKVKQIIEDELRRDPNLTVTAIARVVAERINVSLRTAQRRVSEILGR